MVNPAVFALFFISVYSASVKVAETFFDRLSSAFFFGHPVSFTKGFVLFFVMFLFLLVGDDDRRERERPVDARGFGGTFVPPETYPCIPSNLFMDCRVASPFPSVS